MKCWYAYDVSCGLKGVCEGCPVYDAWHAEAMKSYPEGAGIPKRGLTDEWILEQLKAGCVTTQDLLDAWNALLGEPLDWVASRSFKNKCNAKLKKLEQYRMTAMIGKAFQAHSYHNCWIVIE